MDGLTERNIARIDALRTFTDDQMHALLSWLEGFTPEGIDALDAIITRIQVTGDVLDRSVPERGGATTAEENRHGIR